MVHGVGECGSHRWSLLHTVNIPRTLLSSSDVINQLERAMTNRGGRIRYGPNIQRDLRQPSMTPMGFMWFEMARAVKTPTSASGDLVCPESANARPLHR